MKVLVIGHNVFCHTTNMGKTLMHYFRDFAPEDVAQFYIHAEVPVDDTVCRRYFRFTDQDAIRSLNPLKTCGQAFSQQDIDANRDAQQQKSGVTGAAYRMGRRRTAAIYLCRNLLWYLSRWHTKKLRAWVREFAPDVVFFASGDYAFMYRIARKIAADVQKPLVISCMDDYYLYNKNAHSLLGRLEFALRMREVKRTMQSASCILPICDSMGAAYGKLFHLPAYILHTPAEEKQLQLQPNARQISYIGNLALGRSGQLKTMGRALRELDGPVKWIDVYSGETDPAILQDMTEENGIRFHGRIGAEEVLAVMEKSLAVIHTESFDERMQQVVRFSVSTKIAESLMYGPCLIAYGPRGIASMDYLAAHDAAAVITSPDELKEKLMLVMTDTAYREKVLSRARALAQQNHRLDVNARKVRAWLTEAAEGAR